MTKDKLLETMRQFDDMILSAAFLYAKNLSLYGVDVTKEWITATQNSANLEKAYQKGYYDGTVQTTYKEGLNDAWECAREIVRGHYDDLFSSYKEPIHAIRALSAEEAISKTREYKKKILGDKNE